MTVKHLVLVFEIEETPDEFDPGYLYLDYKSVYVSETDGSLDHLTREDRARIAEHWGQSDKYSIDICADILDAIDSPDGLR